jgi:hypothetical protein
MSFLLTSHQGKLSLTVNGQELLNEVVARHFYSPHRPLAMMEDGCVGFCHLLFEKDNVTTLLHSELRLLPPGFQLERSASKPVAASEIKTAEDLLAFTNNTEWTLTNASGKDEPNTVLLRSTKREFWYQRKAGEHCFLSIKPRDAKSIEVDKGAHLLSFNDDYSAFEINDWPSKGKNCTGKLKTRTPDVKSTTPFNFADTHWQRSDSTQKFHKDGTWEEENKNHPWKGHWFMTSDRIAAVLREDKDMQNFEVSDDGQWIARPNGYVWQAVAK